MNIITHDWNGFGIAQLNTDDRIGKYDIPCGYVNATQMCRANNREWSAYARRKASKAYWEGLADDLQKCISFLIIQVEAYGDEQATWVHPEIAVDLAQWVSIPFKIWANRTLTKLIYGEKTASEALAQSVQEETVSTPKEISEAIACVFCFNTVDPALVQGLIANEIGKAHPQLKPQMEAAKKLLPLPVEEELLIVTELARRYVQQTGKQLTPNNTDMGNAIAFNKLLLSLGLQGKNTTSKQPPYLPTEKGKAFSKIVLQEANGNNKTVQQLRWMPSVLEVFS